MTISEPVLRLEGVTKVYPGPPPVEALRGVDLEVGQGDLLAVVGPSGSGKSTLLHIMGALDKPSDGRVVLEGSDLADLSDRRLAGVRAHRLGFVFQDFFLVAGMTALENTAQGLLYRGEATSTRRRLAAEVLEQVGLGQRLNHLPSQLSGGEKQRVAVARALVGRPAVVFADEPTGNLDSENSAAIVDLLVQLNEQGTTLVVITHDRDVATRCRRSLSLKDGRVEAA